jgi:hypothetical protein
MRSAVCDDGKRRMIAKVEVPIDGRQIAVYAIGHPSLQEYANPLHGIEKLNKRQIYQLAKETIREYGVHVPYKIVEDRWQPKHVEYVTKFVVDMFPECDN